MKVMNKSKCTGSCNKMAKGMTTPKKTMSMSTMTKSVRKNLVKKK